MCEIILLGGGREGRVCNGTAQEFKRLHKEEVTFLPPCSVRRSKKPCIEWLSGYPRNQSIAQQILLLMYSNTIVKYEHRLRLQVPVLCHKDVIRRSLSALLYICWAPKNITLEHNQKTLRQYSVFPRFCRSVLYRNLQSLTNPRAFPGKTGNVRTIQFSF